MAYAGSGLHLIDQLIAGKFRKWIYRTTDSISTVLGAGYFSDATKRGMATGDIIIYTKTDDTPPTDIELRVDSISSGAATVKRGVTPITDSIAGTVSQTLAANAVKAKLQIPIQL